MDKKVRLWNAEDGRKLHEMNGHWFAWGIGYEHCRQRKPDIVFVSNRPPQVPLSPQQEPIRRFEVDGDGGAEARPVVTRLWIVGIGDDQTIGGHSVAVLSHDFWRTRLNAA